jgi:hypothetical protein
MFTLTIVFYLVSLGHLGRQSNELQRTYRIEPPKAARPMHPLARVEGAR